MRNYKEQINAAATIGAFAGFVIGAHLPPMQSLWDSLSGKKPGCSWADNPYVWVIEFEVVSE